MIGFIIGCGRSGTTWLGKILRDSPGFHVTIEYSPIFHLVDQMALNAHLIQYLYPKLVDLYCHCLQTVPPSAFYIDKSHPNIWLVERLADTFPEARFIAIQRSVYATVASMLEYPRVLAHFRNWQRYPVPNRHIGLPRDLAVSYGDTTLVAKCALRWSAHRWRLQDLSHRFPENMILIPYEELLNTPDDVCIRLGNFLERPVHVPDDVRSESLDRWKTELLAEDILEIDRVVETVDMRWLKKCG